MKSSKSSLEAQFGPLQKKTFASALSLFFEQQCPQMGGYLTRQVLVNNIRKLIDELFEYVNLIQENQVTIKEQIDKDGSIFADIPF